MSDNNTKVTVTLSESLRLALRRTSIHNSKPIDEVIVGILKNYYFGRKD